MAQDIADVRREVEMEMQSAERNQHPAEQSNPDNSSNGPS